jgi:tetratricopeptide (TPR) repeat protein
LIRLAAWLAVALSGCSAMFAAAPASASTDAMLALFEVHHEAGRTAEALETLERLDTALPPLARERTRLADGYLRIGQPARAIGIWESLSRAPSGLPFDDRLRLARLYERAGRRQDALALWKQLARDADTPARRSFVEDRLLDAADELHELDSLASELRTEVAARGTSRTQIRGLLVRVLVRKGDKAAAIAAAGGAESSSADSVESLKAQAEVFRGLGDRDSYDRTLRRLVVLDRPHAASHLRKLILNSIERGNESRIDEVHRLLEQLRQVDSQAASAQFEAGALALANLPDAAIASYRRATAADPAIADNWLLLGSLLKKRRSADEAMILFQTLMERDAGDAQFIAGVDGLLDTATPDEYTSPDRKGVAALAWTRARILERLIWKGEQTFLYPVLQELGDALGGPAGGVIALSTSLPTIGERRVAGLRELITLAAQSDAAAQRLRVDYGRRLLALDPALPPDVHISLGQAFLAHGDRHAAQRTFEKAVDEADRSDVRLRVAEELERAGMEAEAAAHYVAALGGDVRNFEVALRLARLRERTGDREGAHDLYGNALRQLLRQQPARGEDVSFDFRTRYSGLLRGYLATWPRDAARAQAELDDIGCMLEDELRFVSSPAGDGAAAELRSFSRLDRIGRFARRVAWATRHAQLAERWDRALMNRFPADTALAGTLAQERVAWGFPAEARQSAAAVSPEIARHVAVMNNDRRKIAGLARDWARSGEPVAALRWAQGRVDPQDYAALCREVAAMLRRNGSAFLPLLQSQPRFIAEIETAGGERILTDDQLMKAVLDPRTLKDSAYAAPAHIDYLVTRLPGPKLLEWAMDTSQAIAGDPARAALPLLELWQRVLAEPLDADFAAALSGHVTAALRNASSVEGQWLDEISAMLIVPRLHASNISRARQVIDSWCEWTRQSRKYYEVPYLIAEGRIDAAVAALAAIDLEVAQNADPDAFAQARQARLRTVHSLLLPRHSALFEQLLQEAPVHARCMLLYSPTPYFGLTRRREPDPTAAEAFLQAALQQSPDDERLLVWQYAAHQERGSRKAALSTLKRLHQQYPDNMAYRAALFRTWLNLQNPAEAMKVNEGSPHDLRRDDVFQSLSSDQASMSGPSRELQVPPLDSETPAPEMGYELLEARDRIVKAAATGDSEAVVRAVRGLWQKVEVTESWDWSNAEDPLAISHANILRLVLEVVPLRSEELEDFLRAMSPREAQDLHRIYGLLADAYRREGKAEQQQELLERQIRSDAADAHDYALWVSLLEKDRGLSRESRESFDSLLARRETLAPHVLLTMARLAAVSDDVSVSERLYQAVIATTLFAPPSAAPMQQTAMTRPYVPILTAPQMAAEIRRVLPAAQADALVRDMLRLLEPDAAEATAMHRCYEDVVASIEAGTMGVDQIITLLRQAAAARDPDDAGEIPPFFHDYATRTGCNIFADSETRMAAVVNSIPAGALSSVAAALFNMPDADLRLPDSRLSLLSMLARRLHASGDGSAAARVIRHIGARLLAQDHFSSTTIERALDVTDEIGQPFDPPVLAVLIERGLLDLARIAPVVQRIAEGGDVAEAMAMGERAAQYTHAPGLIETLISLAERSGKESTAQQWRAVKQADDAARRLLGSR